MVEFRQGFRSMAAPTRELEKLIVSKKLAHGGNPVTRWMAANVAVAQDPAGNLKPAKDKSHRAHRRHRRPHHGHRPRHGRPGRAAALVPDVLCLKGRKMPRCPGAKMLAGANRAAAIRADGTAEIIHFQGVDATDAGTYVLSTRARSTKATHSCAVPRAGDRGAKGRASAKGPVTSGLAGAEPRGLAWNSALCSASQMGRARSSAPIGGTIKCECRCGLGRS